MAEDTKPKMFAAKRELMNHVEEMVQSLNQGKTVEVEQMLIEHRLNNYAKTRRLLDENNGRAVDKLLWRDLKCAIFPHTYWRFREKLTAWYDYVENDILRWERKLALEKFQEDGKKRGVWGNQYGLFVSQLFPSYCGQDMVKPPPYFSVWSQKERSVFENYETQNHAQGTKHRIFWASVAFLGVAYTQLFSISIRSHFLPRNPVMPFVAAIAGSIIPGQFTHLLRHRHRLEAMDALLTHEDSFIAAKARLIADEVMWPEEAHNREYLRHLPRDRFDEFVWSLDDRDVAWGNFDKQEWSFALGDLEANAITPDEEKPPKTREDYVTDFKGFCYKLVGKGWEWDAYIQEKKAQEAEEKRLLDPEFLLSSTQFAEAQNTTTTRQQVHQERSTLHS
eukprot:TRINITY_DN2946_c0_g2_i1.p1 TRINITY_DN2946_c0_g2~~TRINITY_DN2946_c0_g2_i1.p1  ORF type:complete len:399 (+),score=70.18 TRINITY_DN2946_c0_g2_i1:24-1199(+)